MASAIAAALELFKQELPGRVTTSDSFSEYNAEKDRPWSSACWTPAAAYVLPKNEGDVAIAVSIVRKTGCKFVIRTTGNNANRGFSSVDETGFVLDLRGLATMSVDSSGCLQAGSGAMWDDIHPFLESHQLAAMGARHGGAGLGGFLLGGSLSPFPNLYGTPTDGVKGYEKLVLADSSIITASTHSNKELYKCLKGGLSNFGIVTKYHIDTHPLIKVWYMVNVYSPSAYVNINAATIEVQKAMEVDPKIGLFTNFNNGFVAVGLLYADYLSERPTVFDQFSNLPGLLQTAVPETTGTICSLMKHLDGIAAAASPAGPQSRKLGTISTRLSSKAYSDISQAYQQALEKMPAGAVVHYTIFPVGSSSVQAGEDRGGNIMGIEKVPQTWWAFVLEWSQDADAGTSEQIFDELLQKAKASAESEEVLLEFLCSGYAHAEQMVLQSYGSVNVEAMKHVAAQYDPSGLFQEMQGGGFLLRDV